MSEAALLIVAALRPKDGMVEPAEAVSATALSLSHAAPRSAPLSYP